MKAPILLIAFCLLVSMVTPPATAEEELVIKSRAVDEVESTRGPAEAPVITRSVKRIILGVNNVYVNKRRSVSKVADLIESV